MGEIGDKGEGGPPPEEPPTGGYEAFAHGGEHGEEDTEGPAEVSDEPQEPSKGYVEKPLREFRDEFPKEYDEPEIPRKSVEPFGDPQTIAEGINPKRDEGIAYQTNCADCARSVEDTWRGNKEVAAGLVPRNDGSDEGEYRDRMERWAGEPMRDVENMDDIHQKLLDGGHGSSAIIGTEYKDEYGDTYGHFFNAANDGGTVKVIDGQLGESYDWKPGSGHPHLSETSGTFAYGRNGKGEPLWHA
jgi:hypothetical protein